MLCACLFLGHVLRQLSEHSVWRLLTSGTHCRSTFATLAVWTVFATNWRHTFYSSVHDLSHIHQSASVSTLTLTPRRSTNQLLCLCYKKRLAVNWTPFHCYRVSLATWDHTMLPAIRHKRTHPTLTPAIQACTRFTDPERMECWVNPAPGCKEQLAHGCYATACVLRDSNPGLAIVSPAR